jgi:large subunit ribosomal protein L19e
MNLGKKKELAARTLKVGKGRIMFIEARLNEIKEAITKQDIRDLSKDGAIMIKGIKGSKKKVKRTTKKGPGKIKKKVKTRKQDYVIMTRKLRKYVAERKKQEDITREESLEIRKKIRNRFFRSQAHLKEYIKNK